MTTRVYVGPTQSGKVLLPDRTARFERGVALEVTEAEAERLDEHWVTEAEAAASGPEVIGDDLDGLDRDALLKIVEDEQLDDVNRRLGAKNLAAAIRIARAAGADVHDVPEASSEERMHVLDRDCWCGPTVDGSTVHHNRPQEG